MRRVVGGIALLIMSAGASLAQGADAKGPRSPVDSSRLLYKGLGYGSDAYYTPVTVLLNKGFDIFQLRNSSRAIFAFPYGNAWEHAVKDVVRHPGVAIDAFGGWGRLTRLELLPLGTTADEMNWFANYTEHLIAGGLTMRMLDEWYRAHRVPFPRAMAMATTYAASILNEMSEQPTATGPTAGGFVDLIVFDVGAILLFHWDQPTRFFARTLRASDWSNQASITFPNQQLQNNGQYFALKIPVGLKRTRLFLRGGMGAQLGVSRQLGDERSFSIGVGGDTEVRNVDATGHETVEFTPGAGIYYDRNDSLLWSVTVGQLENVVAVNVFPAGLPRVPKSIGLWAVFTRDNDVRLGMTYRPALSVGVGYGR